MKMRRFPSLALSGLLTVITSVALANPTAGLDPAQTAPAFSGDVNSVVKLARSGVDETIVLSYIKNSTGPFQPSAEEIVTMRDLGVSSPVINAMLQRGGELRQESATASTAGASYAPPAYSQPTYAPPAYSEPVVAAAPPVTYVEPAYTPPPVSTVLYIGGSYGGFGYSYPGYRSYYRPYCYTPRYYSPGYSSCYPRIGFHVVAPSVSIGARFGGVRVGGVHVGGGFHFR